MSPLNHTQNASRHYFNMMLESQQDQVPSHVVIGLLYAELIRSLDRLIAVLEEVPDAKGDGDVMPDAELAQSILSQLAESVDFEYAGMMTPLLSGLYARASRDLGANLSAANIDSLRQLRAAISDIAYTWQVLKD